METKSNHVGKGSLVEHLLDKLSLVQGFNVKTGTDEPVQIPYYIIDECFWSYPKNSTVLIIIQCMTNWNPMAFEEFHKRGLVIFKSKNASRSNFEPTIKSN